MEAWPMELPINNTSKDTGNKYNRVHIIIISLSWFFLSFRDDEIFELSDGLEKIIILQSFFWEIGKTHSRRVCVIDRCETCCGFITILADPEYDYEDFHY